MIKTFVLNVAIEILALHILTMILPGFSIQGGLITLFIAGFSLTILDYVVKPILNIISFPVNLLTLGFFSIITNAIILYLLTIFVPRVSIESFTFAGGTYGGISIAETEFTTLVTFILSSLILSVIVTTINWLIE